MNRRSIALGALAMFCVGMVFAEEPVRVKPPQQRVLSAPNGRFVFGQINDIRSDQFMLDTQTGQQWTIRVMDASRRHSCQGRKFRSLISGRAG